MFLPIFSKVDILKINTMSLVLFPLTIFLHHDLILDSDSNPNTTLDILYGKRDLGMVDGKTWEHLPCFYEVNIMTGISLFTINYYQDGMMCSYMGTFYGLEIHLIFPL